MHLNINNEWTRYPKVKEFKTRGLVQKFAEFATVSILIGVAQYYAGLFVGD